MSIYETLRAANSTRQKEWDVSSAITLAFRGNELLGESGEAANVIKKLDRERIGLAGSRATTNQLAEELADIIICTDLVAMHLEIGLAAAIAVEREHWPLWSDPAERELSFFGNLMGRLVGQVCAMVDVLERQSHLPKEDRTPIVDRPFILARLCLSVEEIAQRVGLNVDHAIIDKFNATTRKVGLTTFIAADGEPA